MAGDGSTLCDNITTPYSYSVFRWGSEALRTFYNDKSSYCGSVDTERTLWLCRRCNLTQPN